MFRKEICVKFSEYKQWEIVKEIKKRKRKQLQKHIVIILGVALFLINNPTKIMAVNFSGLDNLGNSTLYVFKRVGYWIATLGAITEIIKSSMQGSDREEIFKVIVKYALIYASLFLVPQLFTLIGETLD